MTTPTLGFIGLGLMGVPMVLRLREAGFPVTVWNREPGRYDLVKTAGAVWSETPAALAEVADVVILCVFDGPAVDACVFGSHGLTQGRMRAHTLIDCSTVPPDQTVELAARLKAQTGGDWVDAPISGGPALARSGRLTLMAGGAPAAYEGVAPILHALASTVTHMGPVGAGQITKVINQAIVGIGYMAMAEVLALADSSEISAQQLPAALSGGLADSSVLQRTYPQMAARDFADPRGYARQLAKDLDAVGDFARQRGLILPIIETVITRYGAWAKEHPDDDSASISLEYNRQPTNI